MANLNSFSKISIDDTAISGSVVINYGRYNMVTRDIKVRSMRYS
jgi:hypothetical protein